MTNDDSLDLHPFNHKVALVRIIPNQILSFSLFSSDPAVSSSIFVGAEREENLIRNDPDKSEFTIRRKQLLTKRSLDEENVQTDELKN